MRILLTNDDGIDAPGLIALHHALRDLGEIFTVAPRTVQSATSHGITYHIPLLTETVRVNEHLTGVAVHGRPADCVKIALRSLWAEKYGPGTSPDLTISGMNLGANVGIHVIYSGTVAAAVESAFHGVPAIAISLHYGNGKDGAKPHFPRAAEIARSALDRILAHPLDPHTVLNLNIPRTESADAPFPPLRVVQMNTAPEINQYERRVSPGGKTYYWSTGDGMKFTSTAPQSDVEALAESALTLTPLTYQLTHPEQLTTWRTRVGHDSS